MSLLPETATYQERLEGAWREIAGRSFSPIDIDFATRLQESGLPIDTAIEVLRSVHKEFQRDARLGEPRGKSLSAYAEKLREAWVRWRQRSIGAHGPASPVPVRLPAPDPTVPKIAFVGPGGLHACGVSTVDQWGNCFGCGEPR